MSAPDVGFFIDAPTFDGSSDFRESMLRLGRMQNVSVDEACAASHVDDPLLCFMAPYATPFVSRPMFLFNSRFDQFQLGAILKQMNWTTETQRAAVEAFGDFLGEQHAELHVVIHNACQTVRRPAQSYALRFF